MCRLLVVDDAFPKVDLVPPPESSRQTDESVRDSELTALLAWGNIVFEFDMFISFGRSSALKRHACHCVLASGMTDMRGIIFILGRIKVRTWLPPGTWEWEVNQGSRRQGCVPEIGLSPSGSQRVPIRYLDTMNT